MFQEPDENTPVYVSPYDRSKGKRVITKKLGRPKIRTEEEVREIRNTISLCCYYEKLNERLLKAKEYYKAHRDEILRKRAEKKQLKKYCLSKLIFHFLIVFVLKI